MTTKYDIPEGLRVKNPNRSFTKEFITWVISLIDEDTNISQLAKGLGINRRNIYRWLDSGCNESEECIYDDADDDMLPTESLLDDGGRTEVPEFTLSPGKGFAETTKPPTKKPATISTTSTILTPTDANIRDMLVVLYGKIESLEEKALAEFGGSSTYIEEWRPDIKGLREQVLQILAKT